MNLLALCNAIYVDSNMMACLKMSFEILISKRNNINPLDTGSTYNVYHLWCTLFHWYYFRSVSILGYTTITVLHILSCATKLSIRITYSFTGL